MRYSGGTIALVIAGAGALAAAPLQAAAPPGVVIGICGQPGIELRFPLAPRQSPVRDDGVCGCHACNTRTRATCCDDDGSS